MDARDHASVFEVINRDLGEVLIGVARDCSLEKLAAEHREYPPVWMASWERGKAEYRWAVCSIPLADAQSFARNYANSGSFRKLTVHVVG